MALTRRFVALITSSKMTKAVYLHTNELNAKRPKKNYIVLPANWQVLPMFQLPWYKPLWPFGSVGHHDRDQ
jgi:hypothetical protein